MFVYLKIYLESYHPITVTIIFWLKLSHTSYPCSRGRNYLLSMDRVRVGYHRVPPQVCLSQMTYKAIHGLAPYYLSDLISYSRHSYSLCTATGVLGLWHISFPAWNSLLMAHPLTSFQSVFEYYLLRGYFSDHLI